MQINKKDSVIVEDSRIKCIFNESKIFIHYHFTSDLRRRNIRFIYVCINYNLNNQILTIQGS